MAFANKKISCLDVCVCCVSVVKFSLCLLCIKKLIPKQCFFFYEFVSPLKFFFLLFISGLSLKDICLLRYKIILEGKGTVSQKSIIELFMISKIQNSLSSIQTPV